MSSSVPPAQSSHQTGYYAVDNGQVSRLHLADQLSFSPLILNLGELMSVASTGLATELPFDSIDSVAMSRVTFILNLPSDHPLYQLSNEVRQLSLETFPPNSDRLSSALNFVSYTTKYAAVLLNSPSIIDHSRLFLSDVLNIPPDFLGRPSRRVLAPELLMAVSELANQALWSRLQLMKSQQFYTKLQQLFIFYAEHLSERAHSLKREPALYASWKNTELKDPIYKFSITEMERSVDYLWKMMDSFINDPPSHQAIPRHAELLSHLNQELQGLTEAWYRFPQLRHEVRRLRAGETVNELTTLAERIDHLHRAILDYRTIYQKVAVRPSKEQDTIDDMYTTLAAYIQEIKLFKIGSHASP